MEGKPTKIHHVPLNLSLADLHSLLRTKIVSIGEPLYDKAYILFGKPRNGVTLASLGKALRRFEMHIRKKAQAALFIKVCKGHFDDNLIDSAINSNASSGVDFYKFIRLLCQDYNNNIQDVLKKSKEDAIRANKKIKEKSIKPWEKTKNKIDGAKQLDSAMRAMNHDYLNSMKVRECLKFIFQWTWLRSKNNFDERNILWNALGRPCKSIDGEKFRRQIEKCMGLRINDKCLEGIIDKYGGSGQENKKIQFDLLIADYRNSGLNGSSSVNIGEKGAKTRNIERDDFNFEGTQFRGNCNEIERLMHKKIKERANPKVGQFKQTFLMFAPERWGGRIGPSAWENHFSSFNESEANQTSRVIEEDRKAATSVREISKDYALLRREEACMGITPKLLKERLKKIGILVSDAQVIELFKRYDTDNNGRLTFYEFAKRAVPPDYRGKGKLYRLTGGMDSEDEKMPKKRHLSTPNINMNVTPSDVEHYTKNSSISTSSAYMWPSAKPLERSFHPGTISMPNIGVINRSSRASTRPRISQQGYSRLPPNMSSRCGTATRSNVSRGLSNAEKYALLQDYKKKRYLKKLRRLHGHDGKNSDNRLKWEEVQRRQKLYKIVN